MSGMDVSDRVQRSWSGTRWPISVFRNLTCFEVHRRLNGHAGSEQGSCSSPYFSLMCLLRFRIAPS